jgi:hypothetical protein
MGRSPGKSISLLAHGGNKDGSNKMFAKMGNDIINGSVEKKENNFMQSTGGQNAANTIYNTDSKKVTLSDQKGMYNKP